MDLSEKFAKGWGRRKEGTPLSAKIRDAVRRPSPLKPRLSYAIKRIEMQIQRLDRASDRFSGRDKSLFTRVVTATSKHDLARANVLANELAEIRKRKQMLLNSRLALEQIVLRFSTISELGDVVTTLAPAVGVLRNVRKGMVGVFPEAERELGSIGTLLSGIMTEADCTTGSTIDFQEVGEGAQEILTEAATAAEQKVQAKFPELPTSLPRFEKEQKLG